MRIRQLLRSSIDRVWEIRGFCLLALQRPINVSYFCIFYGVHIMSEDSFAMDELLFGALIFEDTCDALLD